MAPTNKKPSDDRLSSPAMTPSPDSQRRVRKRVRKACDRCRIKKTKCDGSSPCLRCKTDNVICCAKESRNPRRRNFPQGYAEMLERQQGQLVSCIQRLYKRLRIAGLWEQPLPGGADGQPLTHDVLAALDLLRTKDDRSGELQAFNDVVGSPQSDNGTVSTFLHGEAEVRDRHDSFVDETKSPSLHLEDTTTSLHDDSEIRSKPSIKPLSAPDDWSVNPSTLDLSPDPFPIAPSQIQTYHHIIDTASPPPTTQALADYNTSQAQLFATLSAKPVRRSVYTSNSVHSRQSAARPSLYLDMKAVHQRYPPQSQAMVASSPLCHDWARNSIMLDASDLLGDFRRLSQLGVGRDEGLGSGMM
ncbi:hypothetical protein Q7P36_008904 [Cladosporium allicinum]